MDKNNPLNHKRQSDAQPKYWDPKGAVAMLAARPGDRPATNKITGIPIKFLPSELSMSPRSK
jgi:hypothetical protein